MYNNYILLTFPESQQIMDKNWFEDECILINESKAIEIYGKSAYFVPLHRLKELTLQAYPIREESNEAELHEFLNLMDIDEAKLELKDGRTLIYSKVSDNEFQLYFEGNIPTNYIRKQE